jgi:hypothetical protein
MTYAPDSCGAQPGGIGRRFRKQYPEQPEVQALEVNLHFFLVAVIRLRRCIEGTARRVSGLDVPLDTVRPHRWPHECIDRVRIEPLSTCRVPGAGAEATDRCPGRAAVSVTYSP